MSTLSFYDPMFRVPFFTGLLFAGALPLLGMYLRLREEWLAPLALAQVAAAGALAASIQGLPVLLGSFGAAAQQPRRSPGCPVQATTATRCSW
jgi:zinc/manganese transport system permease protein